MGVYSEDGEAISTAKMKDLGRRVQDNLSPPKCIDKIIGKCFYLLSNEEMVKMLTFTPRSR